MELVYEKNKRFIILILFFLIFIILFLLHGVIINKEKKEQVVKIGFYDDYPHFYAFGKNTRDFNNGMNCHDIC
ncbi:hypothetical protein P5F42_13940 [Clostridium perfringens]|nr:hypothetical protein [Clostridium perfringens]